MKKEVVSVHKKYDELDQKPCPVADFLSDLFEDFDGEADFVDALPQIEKAVLGKSQNTFSNSRTNYFLDTLAVIVRHEQRLNRLDGMDEHNLGGHSKDRMANFYAAWETHYWSREGWEDLDQHLEHDVHNSRVNAVGETFLHASSHPYSPLHSPRSSASREIRSVA